MRVLSRSRNDRVRTAYGVLELPDVRRIELRGGLLIRQVHHWSADLFVAAICLRLLRVFFRGRFSGRALPGWLIWVALLALGILAAYTGTTLPTTGSPVAA